MAERKQTPGAIAWRSAMQTLNSAGNPAALKVAMGKANKILAAADCGPAHVSSVMGHYDKRMARMLDAGPTVPTVPKVPKVRKPRAKKSAPVLVATVDVSSGDVESVVSLETLITNVQDALDALVGFIR